MENSDLIRSNLLSEKFGFNSFQGLQKKIVYRILDEKKHSLVLMPTGGGKSLCFQFPALIFQGGTLVISPLIALMQDQVDALKKKGIPANFINSTVSAEDRKRRLKAFVDNKIKLLYVTPERFRIKEFTEAIRNAKIDLLAVDEAHCISEWGHDFRPDYSRIAEFRKIIGNPLTIALTATATPEVQKDIISKLGLQRQEIKIFHEGIERPNLRLEARDVFDEKAKISALTEVLEEYRGSGIIYFSLIKNLEYYSQILNRKGYNHLIYHGKLSGQQRKQVQRKFLAGENELILATNAFGMGIDKPDIRFVIHAELPSGIEQYYQEIGRAGRDGKPALCMLLYHSEDILTQMEFVKWANPDAGYYHRLYGYLLNDLTAINSMGAEYLMEQLSHKNRFDFRLDTAMGMLDRYGVTEGTMEKKNITVLTQLPHELEDENRLKAKLLSDNKKLLSLVKYFNSETCRRVFISDYFGFHGEKECGNCDVCELKNEEV